MTRLPGPHHLPGNAPRHYPIDWGKVLTMGLILTVECGLVMGIVEFCRRQDEKRALAGSRPTGERTPRG
jgi:hypothetical protein